ncbi:triose-phosphate isomerase ['Osedax' symbiont bacterium Rs2_46_30_T18]|nr:triose-phosphate isomerase ['Osedax' symbiont bacterium Rs2_46_30_T18]
MRNPIVAGNWKMNGSASFAAKMSQQVNVFAAGLNVEVVLSPPSVYLSQVQQAAESYSTAAQNVHFAASGAFTGEMSVSMLQDLGCEYVLVGHSERREMFAENEQFVAKKVAAVVGASLQPILCIGETLEQRHSGQAFDVVKQQLLSAISGLELTAGQLVIAYEPIWAIGTGETATPEQAQEIHSYIRGVLAEQVSAEMADKTRILYGGSVNAETASQLFSQPDIDGGLVGGASLKIEDFKNICSAAANR